jgi:tetratricopeptide (TPR) repeat protein
LVTGLLRQSVETYREVLKIAPENIDAHFGLARAYLDLGDAPNSYAESQRTLELPGLSDEQRHNLEWMAELARPFADH